MGRMGVTAALVFAAMVGTSAPAAAHCDSVDGPVVKAAEQALATGNVNGVLVWVQPRDEAEIRDAFARTLAVRGQSAQAKAMADRWFFETLVRVHRAGEGEPYTGLKPAGATVDPGIAAADEALERGNGSALASEVSAHVGKAVQERWQRVQQLSKYDTADIMAGRKYVEAYVQYIHFIEQLHALLAGGDAHGAGK